MKGLSVMVLPTEDASEFSSGLESYLSLNQISLNSDQKQKFVRYYELSREWGMRMNITTNLDAQSYLCENLLDPILGLQAINNPDFTKGIVDFGAGGGYVGITARILFPHIPFVTLIEAVRKKVSFMQCVIRELGLSNTVAQQMRAEEYLPPDSPCYFASRATWSWLDWQKIAKSLATTQNQAVLLSFEGPRAHEEQKLLPAHVASYQIKPFSKTRYLYQEGL